MSTTPTEPRITVVFLLYHAARAVPALVGALVRQTHPEFSTQSDWLAAVFMDDASSDDTIPSLVHALQEVGAPSHYRVVQNQENLGLAGTLNKAFGLAGTPYVLTCHLDCRFGRDDYVASMLALMEAHPRAAAITGQPSLAPDSPLLFAEKLNLIGNLMDIFPAPRGEALVPVGFAEGRCDVFRLPALRAVGFYDTTLRVAGEDQVLCGKLREAGYEIYQAPGLPYYLSVSGEQDTIGKLVRHQRLFGRAHPYILIRNRGSRGGVVGGRAGANRQRRMLLRVSQVAASGAYLFSLAMLTLGKPAWAWAGPLGLVALVKLLLFYRHLRAVPLGPGELASFFLLQPLLDVGYTVGLLEGLAWVVGGKGGRSIR